MTLLWLISASVLLPALQALIITDPPEKPSISVSPPGGVVEGSTVTLTCSSNAEAGVDTYTLYRDGGTSPASTGAPLVSGDTYTWYRDGGITPISTGPQLVKDNVSLADSGLEFFCRFTNTRGSLKSSPYVLDVQYAPKNVHLAAVPAGHVVEGSSVTLSCSSSASNPPIHSYAIFKDNSVVSRGKTFTISNAQLSDRGAYHCQAENRVATVNSPAVTVEVQNVRLVGSSRCAGELEVNHQREWRPAVDLSTSDWNLQSASVLCRQLGCGSAVDTKWRSDSTPQPVWWTRSSCSGSESSLRECVTMQAAHSEDRLDVICSDLLFQPTISLSSSREGVSEGQRQATEGSSTKGVSQGQQVQEQVIKGLFFTVSCSIQPQYPAGSFHLTTPGVTHVRPVVNHSASFLFAAADNAHQGNYSCVYRVNVFGRDFSSESDILSLTVVKESDVRLVGGNSPCAGTLEVKEQGEWRPAADFTQTRNLQSWSVVCRQLGCGSAYALLWSSGTTTRRPVTPVWSITSSCVGSESSLRKCATLRAATSGDSMEMVCSEVAI